MSFILEALSKAEHERGTAASYTQTLPSIIESNSTSQRLLVFLISIAGSVLVLAGYLAFQHINTSADKHEQIITKVTTPTQPIKKPTTVRHQESVTYQASSLHTMASDIPPHNNLVEDDARSASNNTQLGYVEYEVAQPADEKENKSQLSPSSMHAQIHELEISVHMYSETPSKRFVYIQSARYGEGAKISDGLVLEEITSTGVVLDYRGSLYRLPIKM